MAVNVAPMLTAVMFVDTAEKLLAERLLVTASMPFAVSVLLKAPCTVEVVVETPPLQVTDPPDAICAKLGCPPAAWESKLVHVINEGFVG